MLFNEFTGSSKMPSNFVKADPKNMSKTNPLPQKGKAQDLVNGKQ